MARVARMVGDWLRQRDPDLLALRRAGRMAVAVPLSLTILVQIPALEDTMLFGVFACLSLLTFANFSGPLKRRAGAYLATVGGAIPILVVGSAAGQTVVPAALVMAAVALVVGLLAVLRGYLASAQTVLLLSGVLSLTSARPSEIVHVVLAWLVGGLIATTAAVVLWPSHPYQPISRGLGKVYRDSATATRMRWASFPTDKRYSGVAATARDELQQVHRSFDGNLQRPSGLTSPDRALSSRVDIAEQLCLYQEWRDVTPPGEEPDPELVAANTALATVVADELDNIADALDQQRVGTAHPERILAARDEHLTRISNWVAQRRGNLQPKEMRERVDDTFPLRLTSVSAELAGISGRSDFHDPLLGSMGAIPRRGILQRLRMHTSWDSPWLRLATRTALGLGVSVGIANSLSFQHSFWIVLGTLVALRFDALGTGRTAAQALIGTSVGALLGAGLIAVAGNNNVFWALLLPVALFLAAYTPSTFSLLTAQASFSLAVITLFSLLYPATVETAEFRFVDVAIGLAVSLTISLIIWPRGVSAMLQRQCTEALTAATDYLMLAFDFVCGGAADRPMVAMGRDRSLKQLDRAQEALDLTVAQRPPEGVPLRHWARVVGAARQADASAHLITSAVRLIETRGGSGTVPPELAGPLLRAAASTREALRQAAAEISATGVAGSGAGSAAPTMELISGTDEAAEVGDPGQRIRNSPEVQRLRSAIDRWLAAPDPWPGVAPDPRPAALSWIGDMAAFNDWVAQQLRHHLLR